MDDEAATVIEAWRGVVQQKLGEPVELAAPFQRHYTKLGTGLPPNFCLALTPAEVVALKLDPANIQHPRAVAPSQLKGEAARWPREAVTMGELSEGPLAYGCVLRVAGKRIPCRTPKRSGNPAAKAVIAALDDGSA